jgi:uncharacterized protein YggE
MRFSKNLTLSALALFAFPLLAAAQGPGGPPMHPSTLAVSGSGETRVAPDVATVRLGMLSQAATARAAQEAVNRVTNATVESIKKLGVKPEMIQTSELTLSPYYAQPKPGEENNPPKIAGYQASTMVSVRLKDLTVIGPVIDGALAAGANRLDGVSFGLEDDAAARAEALTRAVLEARSKAETIAKAFGVQLGEILEISEGEVSVSPPPYPQARFAMSMEAADTGVSTGQVGVAARVSVRYRISGGGQGASR